LKALTLTEPWGSAIAAGIKAIETRSWAAPRELIGATIAIHAGKRQSADDVAFSCSIAARQAFLAAGKIAHEFSAPGGHWSSPSKAFRDTKGCVLATATLADCVRFGRLRRSKPACDDGLLIEIGRDEPLFVSNLELHFGDFAPGRYGFILADVEALPKPIPASGALNFWEWTPPDHLDHAAFGARAA
jgi:hypothetical protein